MPVPTGRRVRFALVGILAALAALFVASATSAQFPRRPGSITGGIGGINGGVGGINGGVGGINGGINGGISGISGGIPRPTFPDIPRGPQFEDVWTCGKCKAELGRGPIKPSYASCPFCGVHFVNGGFGGANIPGLGGIPNPPPTFTPPQFTPPQQPPVFTPPPAFNPPQENVGGQRNPNALGGDDLPGWGAPNDDRSKTMPPGGPSGTPAKKDGGNTLVVVLLIVGALVLLLVGGLVVFAVVSNSAGSKRPVKRRTKKRMRDDDEDDDDDDRPRKKRRRDDD